MVAGVLDLHRNPTSFDLLLMALYAAVGLTVLTVRIGVKARRRGILEGLVQTADSQPESPNTSQQVLSTWSASSLLIDPVNERSFVRHGDDGNHD